MTGGPGGSPFLVYSHSGNSIVLRHYGHVTVFSASIHMTFSVGTFANKIGVL